MLLQYTASEGPGESYRPHVALTMCGMRERILVRGLIDSGSDHNLFSVDTARLCGLNFDHADRVKISSFDDESSEHNGLMIPVKYVMEDYEWVGETIFVESSRPYGLLGHVGFFDNFDITFRYNRKIIEVVPGSR